MKKHPILRSLAMAAMAVLLLAACPNTQQSQGGSPLQTASAFTQIVAFGDAYSDSGTFNPSTGDGDPANDRQVGHAETTSASGTWTSYAAAKLGLALTSDRRVDFGAVGLGGGIKSLGGTNYAEGGARIEIEPANNGVAMQRVPRLGVVAVQGPTSRSIRSQIDAYEREHDGRFDRSQLVLIQGGANDFLAFIERAARDPAYAATSQTFVGKTASGMLGQIWRLRKAGATHIVYANLPDLGMTPKYRGTPEAAIASSMCAQYNSVMAAALAGSGVQVFDTAALFSNMIAMPASYGLANVTAPACRTVRPGEASGLSTLRCSEKTLVASGADQYYMFADLIRPSSRVHEIWGARVAQMVLNPS